MLSSPKHKNKNSNNIHSNQIQAEIDNKDNQETLHMVEQFITKKFQIKGFVDILDILTNFNHISSHTAKLLLHRFEKRISTYTNHPFDDIIITPQSSLAYMEKMLIPPKKGKKYYSGPNSQYFMLSPDPPDLYHLQYYPQSTHNMQITNNDKNTLNPNSIIIDELPSLPSEIFEDTDNIPTKRTQSAFMYDQISNDNSHFRLNITDVSSATIPPSATIDDSLLHTSRHDCSGLYSPSPSPHFFSEYSADEYGGDSKDPHAYINYDKVHELDSWFTREKYLYIIALQECAADYGLRLPIILADFIVIYSILLPGCYTLTGLLFPPARNESDLFAEYANQETGYEQAGTRGIQYKRKKPMINIRRPENNTASLWLDEDGTICGFRCIWIHGIRGKLIVDQKFNVLQGCWSLMGELTIIFEQWDVEDEFEGYLSAETFSGVWTAGKELYGEFQWFITTVESFYLMHNINTFEEGILDNDANIIIDHEDDDYFIIIGDENRGSDSGMSDGRLAIQARHLKRHALMGKLFDIEINESLTITCKFLHTEHTPIPDEVSGNAGLNVGMRGHINSSVNTSISESFMFSKLDLMDDVLNEQINQNIESKENPFISNSNSHASRHQISASKTVFLPWNINQYKMTGKVLEISEKGDIDDEIIGYGQWFNHGKISFPMIKYHTEKLMLSFEGCTDGKKVLGRLCIYHDNSPNVDSNALLKNSTVLRGRHSYDEDIDTDDDIDDDIDLHSFFINDITDELDDEDDDDDDERISFVQMIVVSPICNM